MNSQLYALDQVIVMPESAAIENLEGQQDAQQSDIELEQEALFHIENPENSLSYLDEIKDQNEDFLQQSEIQKKLAEEHEQQLADYSILSNQFYENDRIRIFNYTAYNVQQLKTSLINPNSNSASVNELYLSFGYGIEFKINALNRVGYEYISSFPYDRGQLIRLFWIHTLTY
ncbi:hypothetical protein [Acinetobacter bereziniae]|uniref:hypothetical protein n=1 Tax=Acinetobacter bereziniae TaxID=106648 RepID=UPI001D0DA39F|nr:hypothetical protein [Acinetobacter bereziniae]